MDKIYEYFWKTEDINNKNYARKYVYKAYDKFVQHMKNPKITIQKMINKIKNYNFKQEYRPLVWQIFLNVLPFNKPEKWKEIINDNRGEYFNYKNSLITKEINDFIDIEEEKGNENYEKAKLNLSNEDYELISLIKIDINRTYQDMQFFTDKKIKKILILILYIYSKKNSNISYNQGMNEICSILLYTLYQNYYLTETFIKNDETFLYYIIHSNNEFLECDVYTIFKNLMNKDLYIFYSYNKKEYRKSFLSQKPVNEKLKLSLEDILNCNDSEIKKRMYKLFYIDLKKIDTTLTNYLHIEEVDPDLFLLRWYICIFSREFPIEKVILLWDIIFMYEFIQFHYNDKNGTLKSQHLNFIECIILAIFKCLKIKFEKINDKNQFLDILLHQVSDIDISLVYDKAIRISNNLYGNQFPE